MKEKIRLLLDLIKEHLSKIYGDKVKAVILYGSCARGDSGRNSDIDVLVLVDDCLIPVEVRKSLSDVLFDILLEQGEFVSVIVLQERFFKECNSPFIINVKREGILAK